MDDLNLFEPADFSLEELAFAKAHLGESPTVALHEGVPKGVNPVAARALLGRLHELEELRKVKGMAWGVSEDGSLTGFDAITDSIERFMRWQEQCLKHQERGGPRHPSMHTWDSTGAMARGGIGSDSASKIRNEILDDGTRRGFSVILRESGARRRVDMPWTKAMAPRKPDAITLDNGVYQCSVCQKPITSFDVALGRPAQSKARSLVRKHLKTAKNELARHRALLNVPIP